MSREKIELGPTGKTVARNLRRLRTAQNLTLKELADKAARAGRKFGVNALSQAEKGNRRLDVDDLSALAVVLGTTPNALLLPVDVDREQPVEVTGLPEPVRAARAWDWATGLAPLKSYPGEEEQLRVLPFWLEDRFAADALNDTFEHLTPGHNVKVTPELLRASREQRQKREEENND